MGFEREGVLKKIKPIRQARTFQKLKENGRRFRASPWLLVNYCFESAKEGGPVLFLGMTIPRKVANAVQRNRMKRWIREKIRQSQIIPDLPLTVWINFICVKSRNENSEIGKNLRFAEFSKVIDRVEKRLQCEKNNFKQ